MSEQESYYKKKQDPSLKLFVVLTKAQRSVADLVRDDIQRYGLNPTEFGVLELLYHEGEQPLQKIGEKILLASGSITYVVDKLEKKEYLERIPCPNDRRITFASITEKGREFLNDIFPDHWKQIERITGGLTDEEKVQAIELLKKLGKNTEGNQD
ncbi:MarR family transcriptional regulator [Halobacillus halophilus]|uniref:MarR family transcription regulator n=1 Tax=Halobacillus halophilus (strain ATCC 35676 / DSM 2266 / JCM 20832 / KCTC 3685 / LMG 17431 / NBRC 102448 / NCIMB 2269) TaxID=866895 RepID=I0JHY2_HALH3|nr:MarR family transcriptional regulator [Halobacillus halophilus]ASF37952.1 MarR family transcriptional regulator [Halobacillus halophilus]CCG43750.1 MarR family transcription regulator [Halobacillus halophilus DSM 2266]